MNYGQIAGGSLQYANEACIKDAYSSRTVGENIDVQIANLKAQIEALEKTKLDLAKPNGLLNVRIEDLRRAMSY